MKNDDFSAILRKNGYVFKRDKSTIVVTHKGYVNLSRLTAMPEGVKFENQGYVYLSRLTGEHTYRGEPREFRYVDGNTMIFEGQKSFGGLTVHRARYFAGGEIKDMAKCYVAEGDGLFAHGRTIKDAVDDLHYKIADQADKQAVADEVRATGKVTLAQFRALTGACREGVRHHLAGHGIDLDSIDSMPLTEAIDAMSGTSFGEIFKGYVETKA